MEQRAAGGVRCSVWAAASQGHRDSSAARIHQHRLPGICPLPAEGTEKGNPSKNGNAQGSCVLKNKKFASCFLNQHRFFHPHLQLDWEPWDLQPPSLLLQEATTWQFHTQRDVARALQAPARSITAGPPPRACLQWLEQNPPLQLALLLHQKWIKLINFLFFGKAYFRHQNKNLHFARLFSVLTYSHLHFPSHILLEKIQNNKTHKALDQIH